MSLSIGLTIAPATTASSDSSLGNRLAGTIFGGTGSAFENFTSAPQNAPPGATHAAVRVTTRNTTTTDEFGTVTLAAGVIADNFVPAAPSASPIRLISSAINRTTSQVTLRWESSAGRIEENAIGTPNLAYSSGGTTWTTTAISRATVAAGDAYVFSYSGRLDNQTVPGGGTVFVDWFDNSSLLVGSTIDFGGDFQTTSRVAGDPYGNFTHSVTAPLNATFAGVRWGTAGVTGGQVIADNFSIVVPEPSGFALFVGSLGGLCLLRRRA